uniref:Transposase (Putative), gypsy type n=1 Tax=Tanacetum cinerariifolium TaxID=118510 RepID=A0A6L2N887_TANCI|nr:hypothetical protein [Tanacetum cinerariifolium]
MSRVDGSDTRKVRESSRLFIFLYLSRSMGDVDTCLHLSLLGLIFSVFCSWCCQDIGLLDFVKSADPFKVKTRKRTLTQREIPLNNETMNMTVYPFVEIVQIMEHTILDELKKHASKKKKRVVFRIFIQSGLGLMRLWLLRLGFCFFLYTPTPEPDVPEDSGSTQDGGVWTHHASMEIIVSSSSGPDDDVVSPRAEPHDGVRDTAAASAGGTIETTTADNIYVSYWGVTNGARVDNPTICHNLLDHITPPGYWVALRNQSAAGFLDGFNINSTQHTCMVSELRLRYEHEIMTRENFQKKFTDNCVVVQQRDAEIAALKTRLEKAEHEAADVVSLRGHVSKLEARTTIKSEEVNTLNKHNAELLSKVSALESERRKLNRHVIKLGVIVSVCRRRQLRSAELDARIANVRRDIDNDLYPHMFIVIAERRWILSQGVRLAVMKCPQSAKCRSWVKDEFVSTVIDFENVSFALLDELELLKDSPLASIMSALVLKDAQGNVDSTLELQRFQPSLYQVIVPIYSESSSISGEMLMSEVVPTTRAATERRELCLPLLGGTSSFAPPRGSSSGVADYQVYLGFI